MMDLKSPKAALRILLAFWLTYISHKFFSILLLLSRIAASSSSILLRAPESYFTLAICS